MRGVLRGLRRTRGFEGTGVSVFVICVGTFFLFFVEWFEGVSYDRATFYLNAGLLLGLFSAAMLWAVMRHYGWVSVASGLGIQLAGLGLLCRLWCESLVFGLGAMIGKVYDGRSAVETYPDPHLPFLIEAHRTGGLLAYVAGLGLTTATALWEWRARRKSQGHLSSRVAKSAFG